MPWNTDIIDQFFAGIDKEPVEYQEIKHSDIDLPEDENVARMRTMTRQELNNLSALKDVTASNFYRIDPDEMCEPHRNMVSDLLTQMTATISHFEEKLRHCTDNLDALRALLVPDCRHVDGQRRRRHVLHVPPRLVPANG